MSGPAKNNAKVQAPKNPKNTLRDRSSRNNRARREPVPFTLTSNAHNDGSTSAAGGPAATSRPNGKLAAKSKKLPKKGDGDAREAHFYNHPALITITVEQSGVHITSAMAQKSTKRAPSPAPAAVVTQRKVTAEELELYNAREQRCQAKEMNVSQKVEFLNEATARSAADVAPQTRVNAPLQSAPTATPPSTSPTKVTKSISFREYIARNKRKATEELKGERSKRSKGDDLYDSRSPTMPTNDPSASDGLANSAKIIRNRVQRDQRQPLAAKSSEKTQLKAASNDHASGKSPAPKDAEAGGATTEDANKGAAKPQRKTVTKTMGAEELSTSSTSKEANSPTKQREAAEDTSRSKETEVGAAPAKDADKNTTKPQSRTGTSTQSAAKSSASSTEKDDNTAAKQRKAAEDTPKSAPSKKRGQTRMGSDGSAESPKKKIKHSVDATERSSWNNDLRSKDTNHDYQMNEISAGTGSSARAQNTIPDPVPPSKPPMTRTAGRAANNDTAPKKKNGTAIEGAETTTGGQQKQRYHNNSGKDDEPARHNNVKMAAPSGKSASSARHKSSKTPIQTGSVFDGDEYDSAGSDVSIEAGRLSKELTGPRGVAQQENINKRRARKSASRDESKGPTRAQMRESYIAGK